MMAMHVSNAAPCPVCREGEMSLPEKRIILPGFEVIETCEALNDFILSVLEYGTEECSQLQSLGAIYGCTVGDNPCQLCRDGSSISAISS